MAEKNLHVVDYVQSEVRLGRGGFASVFLGSNSQTDELVAIKKIRKQPLIQRAEIFRAHNEIAACTSLTHNNIIKTLAVRENDSEIELVLEYCKDGDLLRRINKYGPNESAAKAMMTQLVPALVYAHQSGWAHMDVKLENILLSGDRYVLADWGLAMPFTKGTPIRSGSGSLLYCPPEMFASKTFHAPPVDVWSLGVCLYACLTGKLPYMGANGVEIQQSMKTSCEMPEYLSPTVRDLLLGMLEQNPQRRLTMEQVASHKWLRHGSRIPNMLQTSEQQTFKRSSRDGFSLKRLLIGGSEH